MSIFNSLFGSSEKKESVISKVNWITLNNLGQLNEVVNTSTEKLVLIFKHSTRCSVSRMALKQFENEFDLSEKVVTYYLDVLENRAISNEIASRFNVYHESPQILVIKDGKSVFDASHSDIDARDLSVLQ
ncbi:bacillithiol system redox-active protein YtxJ [Flavobacterium myungsuense]|uniref:Bacillithiol system redox-active protein YtxJ n=1 Tax=Flavobacterium myungsuense TaxID=651823 RepID=A0ABW3J2E7_9FLAO